MFWRCWARTGIGCRFTINEEGLRYLRLWVNEVQAFAGELT